MSTKQASSVNQPAIPESRVKHGKQTVKLTSEDMYDRIINLRFIHKPVSGQKLPKTFTLRSDYEIVYTKNGYYYTTCKQKPAVKITYLQVSDGFATNINVDITNLFIKDMTSMERSNGEIESIEIQIGYRSQMPNWESDETFSSLSIEEFYALKDYQVTGDAQYIVPAARIVAQVLTTQQLSAPPDKITRFQCVVANVDQGLRWIFNDASIEKLKVEQKSKHWGDRTQVNFLPLTFFENVTRRFVRSSQRHSIETTVDENTNEVKQKITMYNETYTEATVIDDKDFVEGKLSTEHADKYGVIVYMSAVLWNVAQEELPLWDLTDEEVKQTSPITGEIYIELFQKLPAQLAGIAKQYPFIQYYQLSDGNFFAYHANEEKLQIFSDKFVNDRQIKRVYKLPAVYDITWAGTRQIRAPFFSDIGPMATVAFQSRYVLNDLTGNYSKPKPSNDFYLVLLVDLVFSTVGQENIMTLTCVDIQGPATPKTLDDGRVQVIVLDPELKIPARKKFWKKQDWAVVAQFTGEPNTVDSSWESIVNKLLITAFEVKGRWTSPPTAAQALAKLKEWNSTLFSSGRLASKVSPEKDLFGEPVPVLHPGDDSVHVQIPFLPTYPAGEEL